MQPPGAGKKNSSSLQFVSLCGSLAKQMLNLLCLKAAETNTIYHFAIPLPQQADASKEGTPADSRENVSYLVCYI